VARTAKNRIAVTASFFMMLAPAYICYKMQPGDLWVLREVFHGFSEEARTRGFPSPPFGGFGFIGISYSVPLFA
jgi:hypothetical protein